MRFLVSSFFAYIEKYIFDKLDYATISTHEYSARSTVVLFIFFVFKILIISFKDE